MAKLKYHGIEYYMGTAVKGYTYGDMSICVTCDDSSKDPMMLTVSMSLAIGKTLPESLVDELLPMFGMDLSKPIDKFPRPAKVYPIRRQTYYFRQQMIGEFDKKSSTYNIH